MNVKKVERIPEMTDSRIIECWKLGLTVQQISKQYMRNKKQNGIKITQIEAQRHVEPLIFDYQTKLLKA